jgi:NAD(P)H-flavin reductase
MKTKKILLCEVLGNQWINREIFRLETAWSGPPPKAGQFFLIRPERTGCFLSRPVSVAGKEPVSFMIALRGKGVGELAGLRSGDKIEIIGPLGNAWTDFLPPREGGGKTALIGGGIGIAPLIALSEELPEDSFDFYAGFRTMSGSPEDNEYERLLGPALSHAREIIIATEDGGRGNKGFIPAFLDPGKYRAICACGPEPMLKAMAAKCKAAGVPCFISMEKRMACGVGACLGCTVKTTGGNKRCCADGPIFPAEEVIFDE